MSSFNNNNFAGENFGYYFGDEQFQDFGVPSNAFDSDTPIAGPSRSQDWYHNPSTEGYSGQDYQESTLLDASGNQFVDPYVAFESDAPIAGPSGSQDWYLNPPTEGYADQAYQESAYLDASGGQFVDSYAPRMTPTYGEYTGESHCL